MGYPFFSWLPHQTNSSVANRETITLTEDLSDLQITPRRDVFDSYSIFGGRSRENLRAWIDVRITLDRFTDRELFRQFRGMIDHLERGGSVAFGNDVDKCFATTLERKHHQGLEFVECAGNLMSHMHPSAPTSLEVGDEICIESLPPKASREYQTIRSKVVTAAGFNYFFGPDGSPRHLVDSYAALARVRHSDFFPVLILDQSQVGSAMLSHDRRITYTLDLNLAYVLPMPKTKETYQSTTNSEKVAEDNAVAADGGTDKVDYDDVMAG